MRLQKEVIWLLLIGLLILTIVIGLEWMKADQRKKPKSLVMTFIDDAKTSRAFTWYTDNSNVSSVLQIVKGSELKFDKELVTTITGITSTIASSQQVQGVHKAKVSNLEPGTTYSYRVGSGGDKDWSKPAIFTTEARSLNEFTFINVTDSQGITEEDFILWGKTLNKAFEIFPTAQFIIHNGDMTEESDDDKAWDHFFSEAEPWVSQVPLMPVTGNHDEVDGVADHFTSHFNLPNNGAENSIEGTSYSFDYGSAHFVILNTESNIKEQTTWLEEDLAATELPWKIVAMHRGAYGGNMNKKVGDWVSIFDQYKVDLVLQGHNHEYSRSYPLRDGEIVGDGDNMINDHEGTVYVVTNTAGQKFNEQKGNQFYHQVHFQNEKQMFAGVQIKGDSLTFQAYDKDGEKLDEFVIHH
ncbi:purple acid phosphatase family protein [Paenibacillus crassostreae]|uniref:Metallophosphoesterase n=1 Tax=Paenibacillus crassostreae TaxID=1763538 RepID=A0A167G2Z7_9BACL|nr:metallophosphoesterase family protein [Paenibacillus crassostreae]AOZ93812.1 metallophosphoesterase [Paenibacillus crassostreae]OAB77155.1 metallophosphoesterase [Paenibacillus crassostreae]